MAKHIKGGKRSMPVAVCRHMANVYIAMAYVTNGRLALATEVVRCIAAVGAGYPPSRVLNLGCNIQRYSKSKVFESKVFRVKGI